RFRSERHDWFSSAPLRSRIGDGSEDVNADDEGLVAGTVGGVSREEPHGDLAGCAVRGKAFEIGIIAAEMVENFGLKLGREAFCGCDVEADQANAAFLKRAEDAEFAADAEERERGRRHSAAMGF